MEVQSYKRERCTKCEGYTKETVTIKQGDKISWSRTRKVRGGYSCNVVNAKFVGMAISGAVAVLYHKKHYTTAAVNIAPCDAPNALSVAMGKECVCTN